MSGQTSIIQVYVDAERFVISLLLSCRLSLIQGPYSGEGCLPSVQNLKVVGSREPREQAILGEEAPARPHGLAYRLQHLIRLGPGGARSSSPCEGRRGPWVRRRGWGSITAPSQAQEQRRKINSNLRST